mgnify:CR=1 FL=1
MLIVAAQADTRVTMSYDGFNLAGLVSKAEHITFIISVLLVTILVLQSNITVSRIIYKQNRKYPILYSLPFRLRDNSVHLHSDLPSG